MSEFYDVYIRGFEEDPPTENLFVAQLEASSGREAIEEAIRDYKELIQIRERNIDPTMEEATAYKAEGKTNIDAEDTDLEL
jgi:hypothetical protein